MSLTKPAKLRPLPRGESTASSSTVARCREMGTPRIDDEFGTRPVSTTAGLKFDSSDDTICQTTAKSLRPVHGNTNPATWKTCGEEMELRTMQDTIRTRLLGLEDTYQPIKNQVTAKTCNVHGATCRTFLAGDESRATRLQMGSQAWISCASMFVSVLGLPGYSGWRLACQ